MSDLRYPCARCGVMRTKEHGGTVFTVCDACWTQDHGPSFPERLAAAIRERDAAIQRAALAEGKLRETTYAALAAREQGEADTVARIVAWLDDPEGEPISHEMLRGYGLQDYSQRVETCRDMFAEMIKAGAWRGKEGARRYALDCVDAWIATFVEQAARADQAEDREAFEYGLFALRDIRWAILRCETPAGPVYCEHLGEARASSPSD